MAELHLLEESQTEEVRILAEKLLEYEVRVSEDANDSYGAFWGGKPGRPRDGLWAGPPGRMSSARDHRRGWGSSPRPKYLCRLLSVAHTLISMNSRVKLPKGIEIAVRHRTAPMISAQGQERAPHTETMATALILDTNYFLHFRSFDEVNWGTFDFGDELELIVCAVVVRELEEKKRDPRRKLSARARSSVSKLLNLVESEEARTRTGVAVTLVGGEPVRALSDARLDRNIPDDVLIANALELREERRHDRTLIISDDAGVLFKCRTYGVEYWRPPKELRLPEPSDDTDRELRRLKEENQRLKASRPHLFFQLAGGQTFVQLGHWDSDDAETTPISGERMRGDYPALEKDSVLAIGVSEADRLKYNEELGLFHQEYCDFLVRHSDYLEWCSRVALVEFEVRNDGSAPAEDLDIEATFDAGIEVLEWSERRTPPTPPKIPKQPRNVVDKSTLSGKNLFAKYSHPLRELNYDLPYLNSLDQFSVVQGPWISPETPGDVTWYIKYLKHRDHLKLPAVLILLPDKSWQGCKVSYMLHAGNTPTPIEGKFDLALAHDD